MRRLVWILLALLTGVLLTGAVFAYGGREATIEIPLDGDFDTSHVLQVRALSAPAGTISATATITTMVTAEPVVYIPVVRQGTCEDDYEPNDTIGTAYPLPPNTTIAAQFCRNAAVGDDPDDFFKATLSSTARIDALLTDIPANSDLDLYLYDQTGTIIAGSALNGSPEEHFLTDPLAAGVYYLRVYPYILGPDAIEPYQLRWTVK